jgi:hypothetical protein
MSKSRVDRLAEKYSRNIAEAEVRKADRGYWALYRTLDLSQTEVKESVITRVDEAEASQATISRAIKEGDTRALTEPEFLDLGGQLPEEWVTGGVRGGPYPEEWLEAYRDALARATVERRALQRIADTHSFTPEWAARLFPELVGCNEQVAEFHRTNEDEIHHDDHLNHLESVNTDRWR